MSFNEESDQQAMIIPHLAPEKTLAATSNAAATRGPQSCGRARFYQSISIKDVNRYLYVSLVLRWNHDSTASSRILMSFDA